MKKRYRLRLGVLVLAVLAAAAGCQTKKTTSGSKGRIVEKQEEAATFADGQSVMASIRKADGTVMNYVREGKGKKAVVYINQKKSEELTQEYANGFQINSVTLGADGKEYVYLSKQDSVDDKGTIYTDEQLLGTELDNSAEQYQQLQKMKNQYHTWESKRLLCNGKDVTPVSWKAGISDDWEGNTSQEEFRHVTGAFFVLKSGAVIYYDASSSELRMYDQATQQDSVITSMSSSSAWTVADDMLYYTTTDTASLGNQGMIACMNLSTMEKGKSISTKISLGEEMNPLLTVNETGDLYLVNKEGLFCYAKNGTMWEQKLDAANYSIGSPNLTLTSLMAGKDMEEGVYVEAYRNQTHATETYHYYFDKTVASKASQKLKIYSLWNCPTIKEAVRMYQNEHPDVEIEYVAANSQGENQEDQIRELNTEILAGKGADLIVTDGLMESSYINKKILMDLSKVVDTDDILPNIKKLYEKDGSVYSLPVKIAIPVVYTPTEMGDSAQSMQGLANYAQSLGTCFFCEEPKELLEKLLYAYGNEVFLEDGSIEKEKLTAFLKAAMTVYSSCETTSMGGTVEQNQACLADQLYNGVKDNIFLRLSENVKGQAIFANTKSPRDLSMFYAIQKELPTQSASLNSTFVSSGTIAINAKTKYPKAAKDFVKFLFSNTMQQLDNNDGYPVTQKALDNWQENNRSTVEFYGYLNADNQVTVYMAMENSDAEQQQMVDLVQSVDKSIWRDSQAVGMIAEQGAAYLAGTTTLEKVTDEIIQKVDTYIKEQK